MRKVEKGNYVKVHYTGKIEGDGEVFDSSQGCQPLEIQIGSGQVIPGFENALLGMEQREQKTFVLNPAEAYGDRDENLKHTFSRSQLPPDLHPQQGQVLVLQHPQQGQIPATVTEVTEKDIVLDLNHPLAGKTLNFSIEVVEINDQPSPSACSCGCTSCK